MSDTWTATQLRHASIGWNAIVGGNRVLVIYLGQVGAGGRSVIFVLLSCSIHTKGGAIFWHGGVTVREHAPAA